MSQEILIDLPGSKPIGSFLLHIIGFKSTKRITNIFSSFSKANRNLNCKAQAALRGIDVYLSYKIASGLSMKILFVLKNKTFYTCKQINLIDKRNFFFYGCRFRSIGALKNSGTALLLVFYIRNQPGG
ncbi:MAG: hypothetical protein D6677_12205 [Calditrichaeota bacterium]|nr:MAG: hypothetical protein D6677_12205 [Calditrichota bacterium]